MSKLIIIQLITFYSYIYGIDPKVSLAVVQNESNFNPNAVSLTNDVGLFQLHENSFPSYTKKELLDPSINVPLGVQYLAKMKKECVHKKNNDWLVCFNTGPNYAKNNIKHPRLFPYVRKIAQIMENKK